MPSQPGIGPGEYSRWYRERYGNQFQSREQVTADLQQDLQQNGSSQANHGGVYEQDIDGSDTGDLIEQLRVREDEARTQRSSAASTASVNNNHTHSPVAVNTTSGDLHAAGQGQVMPAASQTSVRKKGLPHRTKFLHLTDESGQDSASQISPVNGASGTETTGSKNNTGQAEHDDQGGSGLFSVDLDASTGSLIQDARQGHQVGPILLPVYPKRPPQPPSPKPVPLPLPSPMAQSGNTLIPQNAQVSPVPAKVTHNHGAAPVPSTHAAAPKSASQEVEVTMLSLDDLEQALDQDVQDTLNEFADFNAYMRGGNLQRLAEDGTHFGSVITNKFNWLRNKWLVRGTEYVSDGSGNIVGHKRWMRYETHVENAYTELEERR